MHDKQIMVPSNHPINIRQKTVLNQTTYNMQIVWMRDEAVELETRLLE